MVLVEHRIFSLLFVLFGSIIYRLICHVVADNVEAGPETAGRDAEQRCSVQTCRA